MSTAAERQYPIKFYGCVERSDSDGHPEREVRVATFWEWIMVARRHDGAVFYVLARTYPNPTPPEFSIRMTDALMHLDQLMHDSTEVSASAYSDFENAHMEVCENRWRYVESPKPPALEVPR